MMKILLFLVVLYAAISYNSTHLRHAHHHKHLYDEVDRPLDEDVFFLNTQGMAVHHRRLGKAVDPIKGVVIICHGYAEHLSYYAKVADAYNKQGLIVYGIDHIGHGKSEGQRAYVADMNHLVHDILQFTEIIHKKHPEAPMFIHGHSMGGLIATLVMQRTSRFTAAFLEAPLIRLAAETAGPVLEFIGRILNSILPQLRLPGTMLKGERMTNSDALLKRWKADPYRFADDIQVNTGFQLMLGCEEVASFMDSVEWPFFIALADDDSACDVQGGLDFYAAAKSPGKKMKMYEGFRHAMHHEPNGAEVVSDAVSFFTSFL